MTLCGQRSIEALLCVKNLMAGGLRQPVPGSVKQTRVENVWSSAEATFAALQSGVAG